MGSHITRNNDQVREVLKKRSVKDKNSNCWNWLGSRSANKYGCIHFRGRTQKTHRVSYILFVGEIPKDLTIDHICRNTLCINPAHLRPMSLIDNIMAGNGICVKNKNKTHCVNGHDITNGYVWKRKIGNPVRVCRKCLNIRQNAWRAKKRSLAK